VTAAAADQGERRGIPGRPCAFWGEMLNPLGALTAFMAGISRAPDSSKAVRATLHAYHPQLDKVNQQSRSAMYHERAGVLAAFHRD